MSVCLFICQYLYIYSGHKISRVKYLLNKMHILNIKKWNFFVCLVRSHQQKNGLSALVGWGQSHKCFMAGVDTKQQLSKQRLLQNSEITKQRLLQNSEITQQRLLQNSDSYKTATVTKQRLLQKKYFDIFNNKKHHVIYFFNLFWYIQQK